MGMVHEHRVAHVYPDFFLLRGTGKGQSHAFDLRAFVAPDPYRRSHIGVKAPALEVSLLLQQKHLDLGLVTTPILDRKSVV